MQKKFFIGLLAGALFTSVPVFAEEIKDLKIIPPTDYEDKYINVFWDALPDNVLVDVDKYALQYSTNKSDMTNQYTKTSRSQKYNLIETGLEKGDDSFSLHKRTFKDNTNYYFRIFTLKEKNGNKYLTNGSKIIEMKWDTNGKIPKDEDGNTIYPKIHAPNDPVIVDNSDDEDENTSSHPDVDVEGFTSSMVLDHQVNLKWSRPNLSESEFDGFLIDISDKANMDNVLATLKAGEDIFEGCVKELAAEKTYYMKAYFYKSVGGEKQRFGASDTINITTEKAFTDEQLNKIEIKKANNMWPKDPIVCVDLGEDQSEKSPTTTTNDNNDEESSNTNTRTSTNTRTTTSKTVSSGDLVLPKDVKTLTLKEAYSELRELSLRINKLRNWIRQLNLQLEQG